MTFRGQHALIAVMAAGPDGHGGRLAFVGHLVFITIFACFVFDITLIRYCVLIAIRTDAPGNITNIRLAILIAIIVVDPGFQTIATPSSAFVGPAER